MSPEFDGSPAPATPPLCEYGETVAAVERMHQALHAAQREQKRLQSVMADVQKLLSPQCEDGDIVAGTDRLHKARHEALAQLQRVTSELEGLKASWGDKEDEYTARIDAAHPMEGGADAIYQTALKMVGNRHGKYELVNLVNWLLAENVKLSKLKNAPAI